MSKIIYFEDGDGGLLSISPAMDDRSRRRILVSPAVMAIRTIPAKIIKRTIAAELDVLGNEIAPAREIDVTLVQEKHEEYEAEPAVYRLETDDEVAARAALLVPDEADRAVFDVGVTEAELAARFPNYGAQRLSERRAARDGAARDRTRDEIVAGFTSDALGAPHLYPSNETDQQNLTANVVSSMLPDVDGAWRTHQLCADGNGVWTYREHSAAQIQHVGRDAKARVLACLTRGAELRAAIAASSNPESIDLDAGWPA